MNFVLHQILLFPKDKTKKVRNVDFTPGVVNVVTGTSARGKSALSKIIDYCLGSSKCAIPVGEIRRTVEWYGIVAEIGSQMCFFARRDPGKKQATDDYCVAEDPHLAIPLRPEKNASRSSVLQKINTLAGLPNLELAPGKAKAGYDARPSFRDLVAFNFLPQHIVANPQTLFFKADTAENRERLQRVFPLALGAVTADYLLAEHEAHDLKRQLQGLERDMERRQSANTAWLAELDSFYSSAVELGLVSTTNIRPTSSSQYIDMFRRIVADASRQEVVATPGGTEDAVAQLTASLNQERDLARRLSYARRTLQRLRQLTRSVEEFSGELFAQSARLESVPWYERHLSNSEICPFCGVESDSARVEVEKLIDASKSLQAMTAAVERSPTSLEREQAELARAIRSLEEEIRINRLQRRELEDQSTEAAASRQTTQEVFRFIGRLEQAIRNAEVSDEAGELAAKIDQLKKEFVAVQKRMNKEHRTKKENAALERISLLIGESAKLMELERRNEIAKLIPRELALVFEDKDGDKDYLWEIGSGENWMGYHISLLLALHEYFLSLENGPVASFLVIDQPTQVYFPARNDTYDRLVSDQATSGAPTTSGDIPKARRIFETLSAGLKRMQGRLQIIVTEHADELTWGGVENVVEVENWRGDQYLIPQDWLGPQTTLPDEGTPAVE